MLRRKPGGLGEAEARCHSGEFIPRICLSGAAGIWEPWERLVCVQGVQRGKFSLWALLAFSAVPPAVLDNVCGHGELFQRLV